MHNFLTTAFIRLISPQVRWQTRHGTVQWKQLVLLINDNRHTHTHTMNNYSTLSCFDFSVHDYYKQVTTCTRWSQHCWGWLDLKGLWIVIHGPTSITWSGRTSLLLMVPETNIILLQIKEALHIQLAGWDRLFNRDCGTVTSDYWRSILMRHCKKHSSTLTGRHPCSVLS